MFQSIPAVDTLAIQRSLTILEDRHRELREIGEKRFQAWDKEKGELKEQVVALKAELDAVVEEKALAEQRATDLKEQKQKAVEEAELTLLQLHQVQEELEHYFLKAQEAEGQVVSMKEQAAEQAQEFQQTQAARNEQAARAENLAGELAVLKEQKQEAIEEAELTLLQLHQVQEELEHYFLNAQSAEQLATAQQDQLLRAQALMARVLPEAAAQPLVQGLEVEVLPPLTTTAGVQTEALLSSYASSLNRAASLLQRAMQL